MSALRAKPTKNVCNSQKGVGDKTQSFSFVTDPFSALVYNRGMKKLLLLLMLFSTVTQADSGAEFVQTPYTEQKVLFDFYFDDPAKINSALYWIRALMNPLMDAPYDMAPEFMDLKVIIHGTEIVSVAKKNYDKYKDAVERMRYYSDLGVELRRASSSARRLASASAAAASSAKRAAFCACHSGVSIKSRSPCLLPQD